MALGSGAAAILSRRSASARTMASGLRCLRARRLATAAIISSMLLLVPAASAEDKEAEMERLWRLALEKIDKNNDRLLQLAELKNARPTKWIAPDLHADYIAFADTDGDGVVERREFSEQQRYVNRHKDEA